jgi:hypothetical protein
MPDLAAPGYQIARFVIERGLGAIYLIAFLVAARQFLALLGEDGLEPAPQILRATTFWQTPSVFHWGYSDRRLQVVAWTGVAIAAAVIIGLPQAAPLPVTMLAWFSYGSSTSRSPMSVAPSTRSAGSRCCWRPDSWRSSWATPRRHLPSWSSSRSGGSPSASSSARG